VVHSIETHLNSDRYRATTPVGRDITEDGFADSAGMTERPVNGAYEMH